MKIERIALGKYLVSSATGFVDVYIPPGWANKDYPWRAWPAGAPWADSRHFENFKEAKAWAEEWLKEHTK